MNNTVHQKHENVAEHKKRIESTLKILGQPTNTLIEMLDVATVIRTCSANSKFIDITLRSLMRTQSSSFEVNLYKYTTEAFAKPRTENGNLNIAEMDDQDKFELIRKLYAPRHTPTALVHFYQIAVTELYQSKYQESANASHDIVKILKDNEHFRVFQNFRELEDVQDEAGVGLGYDLQAYKLIGYKASELSQDKILVGSGDSTKLYDGTLVGTTDQMDQEIANLSSLLPHGTKYCAKAMWISLYESKIKKWGEDNELKNYLPGSYNPKAYLAGKYYSNIYHFDDNPNTAIIDSNTRHETKEDLEQRHEFKELAYCYYYGQAIGTKEPQNQALLPIGYGSYIFFRFGKEKIYISNAHTHRDGQIDFESILILTKMGEDNVKMKSEELHKTQNVKSSKSEHHDFDNVSLTISNFQMEVLTKATQKKSSQEIKLHQIRFL